MTAFLTHLLDILPMFVLLSTVLLYTAEKIFPPSRVWIVLWVIDFILALIAILILLIGK